ncbi:MAG: ribosomal L7Ae/L30e/S12e/Gadd45 family protein [Clostridia bacterium]|nr:ribosomal L7Ae/L30e/S12e/Gadd45 family protein [Clostridia bacterium]
MNIRENMNFLGICRKAGKLSCGHDAVKETIVKSKSQLIIMASDASERLEREMRFLCTQNGRSIPVMRTKCSMKDFAQGIGKGAAVFSVTDTEFAEKLQQKFGEELDDN